MKKNVIAMSITAAIASLAFVGGAQAGEQLSNSGQGVPLTGIAKLAPLQAVTLPDLSAALAAQNSTMTGGMTQMLWRPQQNARPRVILNVKVLIPNGGGGGVTEKLKDIDPIFM